MLFFVKIFSEQPLKTIAILERMKSQELLKIIDFLFEKTKKDFDNGEQEKN